MSYKLAVCFISDRLIRAAVDVYKRQLWDGELRYDGYFPLEISPGASILDKKRHRISTFDELENKLSEDNEHIFNFEDAYVDTRYLGQIKINAVKYISNKTQEKKIFAIDARNIICLLYTSILPSLILPKNSVNHSNSI